MKKLYSIVLMAAALLIGTSAWANSTWESLPTTQGANKISVEKGGVTKYAASLQTAIDAVDENETAQITLLADQELTATVLIPNYLAGDDTIKAGTTNTMKPIRTRGLQDITLDLNGFDITEKSGSAICLIQLMKGKLFITGEGELKQIHPNGATNIQKSAIFVSGAPYAYKNTLWSELIIDENVFVNATGKVNPGDVTTGQVKNYGITIDNSLRLDGKNCIGYKTGNFESTNNTTVSAATDDNGGVFSDSNIQCWAKGGWNTNKTTWSKKQAGSAYGVKIVVKGKVYGNMRGINFAGNINATPACDEGWGDEASENGRRYSNPAVEGRYYNLFYPYIKIEKTAHLWCLDDGLTDGNGGIYAGGWAVWDIHGYVHGQTGVFIKSGDAKFHDAVIKSDSQTANNDGEYHGDASGTGVFVTSDQSYAGNTSVLVTGDTKVTGGGASAITDVLTDNVEGKSTVSHITIEGGTIEPGKEGAINLNSDDVDNTTVSGGNITGTVTSTDAQTGETTTVPVVTLVPTDGNHHATEVVVDGKSTIVISEGQAPTSTNSVINAAENTSINWNGTTPETLTTSKTLAELEINQNFVQTLTIKDGVTFTVGRVVLGENARIIVEAGGKFIVSGAQGIVAPVADNILLQAEEGNPAIFVFNPAVTSNRHPKATVEFVSRSFTVSSSNYAFQRFGIPTTGKLADITTKYNNADVPTYFMSFNYVADDWASIGYINAPGKTQLDTAKLSNPFEYYQMQHNTPNMGTVVTFKGELVGNEIPQIAARAEFWNGYANSTTGNMSIKEVLNELPTGAKSVYLNNVQAHQKVWEPYTLLNSNGKLIQPMQPFLVRNTNSVVANIALDYGDAVYYPTTGETKPNAAPARRSEIDNITMANIIVNGENTYDRVIVAEDAEFSADFEDGYDAVKFMNSGINMYVSADEKMAIFATDNLENTYVGFQAVNGGNYTIEFANVQGEELTLVDHETGAEVLMVEGNTYEFTADANSANDYRFEIVSPRKVTTAIENAEAVKNVKGIYTITGQYMGEMNVWNSLPAGVYVVNGEKRVK